MKHTDILLWLGVGVAAYLVYQHANSSSAAPAPAALPPVQPTQSDLQAAVRTQLQPGQLTLPPAMNATDPANPGTSSPGSGGLVLQPPHPLYAVDPVTVN